MSVGHSDEGVGLSSYHIRYKGNCHSSREWRHLVHDQVAQFGTGGHSDENVGLVPTRSDVIACPFDE